MIWIFRWVTKNVDKLVIVTPVGQISHTTADRAHRAVNETAKHNTTLHEILFILGTCFVYNFNEERAGCTIRSP